MSSKIKQYKVGQAVKNTDSPVFFKTKDGWKTIDGKRIGLFLNGHNFPLATEAEILAEAQKHGWDVGESHIKNAYWTLTAIKSETSWYIDDHKSQPSIKDQPFKNYCEQGLELDRLVTALNLVPKNHNHQ